MNPLDWLLLALVVYSVVRAAMRGLLREAFALGGVVVGMLVAAWNYRTLAPHLSRFIASQAIAQFTAFVLLLVAVILIASIIGKLLTTTASAIGLGFVNRLLGALFGLLRGCLLGIAIIGGLTAFLPALPWAASWMATSRVAPYLLRAIPVVSFVMPTDLRLKLLEGADSIKHTSAGWIKPTN